MTPSISLSALDFTKMTLANGLDVIVRRDPRIPLVAVNLWYHVGSKNEQPGQRGFAHLFEHLMFEGSENYPGDYFKPLQRLGALVNGSTSADRTNYFEDLPSAHLEFALAMESDRMENLVQALTESKLRIQKDVVKNEYLQNYANRPYGQVGRLIAESLYPPAHPYHWLTIGRMEEVENASLADVEAFFRRYYVPSNASLCLVGDFEEHRATELAQKYFGGIVGGVRALTIATTPVRLESDQELVLRDRVELDRIYLSWHSVPRFDTDDAPLVILADALAMGRSSRLYRKLVVEDEIAQDVSAWQSGREIAGSFTIAVTLRPGKALESARDLCLLELERIAREAIQPAELERILNSRLAGFVYSLDQIGGFDGIADRLNAYNSYLHDPSWITRDFERFRKVAIEDVRAATQRYLVNAYATTIAVRGSANSRVPAPLDRSLKTPLGAPVVFQAPIPEQRTLANGLNVWLLPRRDLPIVAATAAFRSGAASLNTSEAGHARLTAVLMREGTHRRSALEIAEEAQRLGTSLYASTGWDGSYVGFQAVAWNFESSLDLALDILQNPTFPDREWQRVRGQTLAALKAERDSAEARAHRAFLRAVYPLDHPYSSTIDGDSTTVSQLQRADLPSIHQHVFQNAPVAWIVAGDFDPDRACRLLEALPPAKAGDQIATNQALALPSTADQRRLILLDRPGAPQAVVRIGHMGAPRNDPGFHALSLLNHILGGQFTSRLNAKLREEMGITYSIRGHLDFRRQAGPFSISASVATDRVADAITAIAHEIEQILGTRPPSEAELEDARRSIIEGQARHFETASDIVARYAGLFVHNLPIDEYTHVNERLCEVTLADLVRSGNRVLKPGGLVAVVVADAAIVEPALDRLGWGKVERVQEDPPS